MQNLFKNEKLNKIHAIFIYCVHREWDIFGTTVEMRLFDRSSALTSTFLISIAFIIVGKGGQPNSLTRDNFK